jgi:hypothetical protein
VADDTGSKPSAAVTATATTSFCMTFSPSAHAGDSDISCRQSYQGSRPLKGLIDRPDINEFL